MAKSSGLWGWGAENKLMFQHCHRQPYLNMFEPLFSDTNPAQKEVNENWQTSFSLG